jgi:hypothetical protein
VESFVQLDSGAGGWSKYYIRDGGEVGIWGTASGLIGICLGERLGIDMGRDSRDIANMKDLACGFLTRQQLSRGRNVGAWSISQLKNPAFIDTTTIAARAVRMADLPQYYADVASAVRWLMSRQLKPGGWSNLERDPRERLVAKTCPTAYSILTIQESFDLPVWSAEDHEELRKHRTSAARALRTSIAAMGREQISSGWGRSLADPQPVPAYTCLAVTALRSVGDSSFINSYAASLARLFAKTQGVSADTRFDQAPWPNVRDVWTPPAPLAERFMMFFTTAWLVRALAGLDLGPYSAIREVAMSWLVNSDTGGKYYHYFNYPHNFASMDALWACLGYLQYGSAPTGEHVDALGRDTPLLYPDGKASHGPALTESQLALWTQAAEQLRQAINDQIAKRSGSAIRDIPSVHQIIEEYIGYRSEFQRLSPKLDKYVSEEVLSAIDVLGKKVCGMAWPDLSWPS